MIPDAAVEAAAEAIPNWMGAGRDDLPVIARAAVEAAMPAIREAIAQEIEAERYKRPAAWCEDFEHGLDRAARIVRGGTP